MRKLQKSTITNTVVKTNNLSKEAFMPFNISSVFKAIPTDVLLKLISSFLTNSTLNQQNKSVLNNVQTNQESLKYKNKTVINYLEQHSNLIQKLKK